MSDKIENITLRISKSELDVINDVVDSETDLFEIDRINEKTYIIIFVHIDKAIELDELIKDKLVYKGFDLNYNPNEFGRICEDLIDKFYKIIE